MKSFYRARSRLSCLGSLLAGVVLGLSTSCGWALGPGNLMFIGFNSDGNDDFSVVALTEVPTATTVYFRNSDWDGASFSGGAWQKWESGGSAIAAGTVISFTSVGTTGRSVSHGSLTAGQSMSLSGSNEGLWAYHGSDQDAPTAFLTFVSNEDTMAESANAITGTGLTSNETAILIAGDEDIVAYNGARTGSDAAGYRSLIGNAANWITQDGTGDQSIDGTGPDVPFDSTSFVLLSGIPAPVANEASTTNTTSFRASWTLVSSATGYRLDVATNSAFAPSGSDALANDFEGVFPPDGWTHNSVDQSTTYAHSGLNSARLNATDDYLVTPQAEQPGSLAFWTYTTSADPGIVVKAGPSLSGPWTEVAESPFSGNTAQWNLRTVDLSSQDNIFVQFSKTGSSGTLYIDDISIGDLGNGDFVAGYEDREIAGGATVSTSVTGLLADTVYYYRVRATNTLALSSHSNTQAVRTLMLQAPVARPASATNDASFSTAWLPSDGATGYRLDVATNSAFTASAAGDVLVSELCDPKNDFANNRFIEIYNAGPTSVNLTAWSVVAVGNGSEVFRWELSGVMMPGQALVCGDDDVSTVGFDADFPDPDWSAHNSSWNGGIDDGAQLRDADDDVRDQAFFVDLSGDETVYRISSVATAQPVYVEAEWLDDVADDATDGTPGVHACDFPDWGTGDFVAGYERLDVGNVTSVSVTGLSPVTTYYYRLRAYDADTATGPSNTESVRTLARPEPSAHAMAFTVAVLTHRTIGLSWTAAGGAVVPDGYLLLGTTNTVWEARDPVDGIAPATDLDWSDGDVAVRVPAADLTYEFRSLASEKPYSFKLFPFSNSATDINFKTNGVVPSVSTLTEAAPYEDFEDVVQLAYTNGLVALDSGSWTFNESLLGISTSDRKRDQQSLRMRESGFVTFTKTGGAGTLSLKHAAFGTDTGCSFRVLKSSDGGTTWLPLGNDVSCTASLGEAVFTVGASSDVSLRISNLVSTASHRLNVDNICVTDYVKPQPHVGTVISLR